MTGAKEERNNEGLWTRRFEDNPEERRFAEAWAERNDRIPFFDWLLDERSVHTVWPRKASPRDRRVAATVVQWLGSPVGQGFLRDLGYVRAEDELADHSEERRFACVAGAWVEMNDRSQILDWLLDERPVQSGRPLETSPRDRLVAVTVFRWLGGPAGRGFFRDLGYVRKSESESEP